MFCRYCGTSLPDDANFCSACGKKLAKEAENMVFPVEEASAPEAAEATEVMETTEATEETEQVLDWTGAEWNTESETSHDEVLKPVTEGEFAPISEETSASKKKKRRIIIPIVIAVVVLALAAAAAFVFMTIKNQPAKDIVSAYVEDGVAYLCYADGKVVKFGSAVEEAYMTPDRKKIVVLEEDRVYWTTPDLSKRHVIADSSAKDVYFACEPLTDRFAFVLVEEENEEAGTEAFTALRYEFKTRQKIVIASYELKEDDNIEDIDFADLTWNHAYTTEDVYIAVARDGKIEFLSADSNDTVVLDHYTADEDVDFLGISEDGRVVSWIEAKEDSYRLMASIEGNTQVVLSENESIEAVDFYMHTSPDGGVVINGSVYSICIKEGVVTKVKFANEVHAYLATSTNGRNMVLDDQFCKADGYYVLVNGAKSEDSTDNFKNLYYIAFDSGEKSKLLANIFGATIAKDMVIYQDHNETLKCGTINLKNETVNHIATIAKDIYGLYYADGTANYLYYTKKAGTNQDTFHLYFYNLETGESEKIASNVSSACQVSYDGNYVYYLADVMKDDDTYETYGSLTVYHAKKAETIKIANDICSYSLDSGLLTGYIDPDSFFFEKYDGVYQKENNSHGRVIKVCYYNGKKVSTVIASLND